MNSPALAAVPNKLDETIKKALSELQLGESIIRGVVDEITQPQNGEYNYYTINLAAADAYSLPPVIQVSQLSKERPFAMKGEEVVIHVKNGGYPQRSNGVKYIRNTNTLISRIN